MATHLRYYVKLFNNNPPSFTNLYHGVCLRHHHALFVDILCCALKDIHLIIYSTCALGSGFSWCSLPPSLSLCFSRISRLNCDRLSSLLIMINAYNGNCYQPRRGTNFILGTSSRVIDRNILIITLFLLAKKPPELKPVKVTQCTLSTVSHLRDRSLRPLTGKVIESTNTQANTKKTEREDGQLSHFLIIVQLRRD